MVSSCNSCWGMEGFCSALQSPVSLWVSSTVINSRVFSLQTVHLEIHLLSAVVSGDDEPTLDWLGVEGATAITVNEGNPLQSFTRSLSDPSSMKVTTKPRISTRQFVGFSWLFICWFRFSQCLSLNTCVDRTYIPYLRIHIKLKTDTFLKLKA